MSVILGKSGNRNVTLDLDVLLRTRLLVQANSGGGKSWLLRRLAEQLFGKIPVIIVDPEGEFATLREKYNYVLVGKGGETPADPRSANLVAQKLLELRVSAVCDLYEMKPSERHHWVRLFLEALIDAPKKLWRPTVVIVDEAHTFCPEKGAGESEASDAMTALPTRGRKRRFCAVWATQRLGKLRKDASAELLNRLIGPTFEDVDLKRAAELLSIRSEDRRAFDQQMRVLEPGFFFALGRAITKERLLVRVGSVETSHEIEDAKYGTEAPPTPDKIKALLPKLADLPKQAEEKAKTEAELRTEVRSLKAQLRAQPSAKPQVQQLKVIDSRAIERAVSRVTAEFKKKTADLERVADEQFKVLQFVARESAKVAQRAIPRLNWDYKHLLPELKQISTAHHPMLGRTEEHFKISRPIQVPGDSLEFKYEIGGLPKGERDILRAVAQHENAERNQISVLTGYKRSTRDAYISRLMAKGFLSQDGQGIQATAAGLDALGSDFEPLPTGPDLQRWWLERLPEGEKKLLELLLYGNRADGVSREQLTESSGYKRSTRDAYLARMAAKKIVEFSGRGIVRISENLL